MQTAFDDKLKILFAQAEEPPADDAFTSETIKRIHALQRRDTILQYSGVVLVVLLMVFFSADIINAVNWASIKIDSLLTNVGSAFTNTKSFSSKIPIPFEQQSGVLSIQEVVAYIASAAIAVLTVVVLFFSGIFQSHRVYDDRK